MTKMPESKNVKQGIIRSLDRIEKILTDTKKCEDRLSNIKPIDFNQNESVEILKQILENQYKLSKIISYVVKYVHKKEK